MIKILLVILAIGVSQAAPTWVGRWYVRSSFSNNDQLCPVPAQLTNATITVNNNSGLTLTAVSAGIDSLSYWDLPWNSSASGFNVCNDSWCVTSLIIGENATIAWTGYGIYIGVRCNVTLSRPAWLGEWYVISTYTDSHSWCPVPQLYSTRWNSYSNGYLQSAGLTTLYGSNMTFTLAWNPFDRNVTGTYNGCNQTGFITTLNGNSTASVQITCPNCEYGWTITTIPEIPPNSSLSDTVIIQDPLEDSHSENIFEEAYY